MGCFFGTDHVQLNTAMSLYNPCSVSFWYVYLGASVSQQRFFGCADNFEGKVDPVYLDLFNEIFRGTGGYSADACSSGVWCHIVFTAYKSTASGKTYFNGVESLSEGLHNENPSSPATISIGNRTGAASNQSANGIIEDFRIYDKILTPIEIKIIYDCCGTDSIFGNLKHRFLFCETKHGGSLPATSGHCKDITGLNHATKYASGTAYYYGAKIKMRKEVCA